MSLIGIILTIAVVGIVLLLFNSYIPMEATVKKILNAVVLIALIVWLLRVFHLIDYFGNVRV